MIGDNTWSTSLRQSSSRIKLIVTRVVIFVRVWHRERDIGRDEPNRAENIRMRVFGYIWSITRTIKSHRGMCSVRENTDPLSSFPDFALKCGFSTCANFEGVCIFESCACVISGNPIIALTFTELPNEVNQSH